MSNKYYLNSQQEFVIENYNHTKAFSSFLPAIAGVFGKPLWAYYVNRGQCISSFGINNKDYSIMEFQPANKAYRQTSTQGFRTFLRITDINENEPCFYEPFQARFGKEQESISQKMYITSYDLKLVEVNEELGLKFEATFCTLPNERLSGLIKSLVITNLSNHKREIEVLDGIPVIIPYYLINNDMKNESNLRQAWMGVDNHDSIPFYRIKVLPYDTPETQYIEGGNFFINFDSEMGMAKAIVDPSQVFGYTTDLSYPSNFFEKEFQFPEKQVTAGVTPCAFGYQNIFLQAKEAKTSYMIIGSADSNQKLIDFVNNTLAKCYIEKKIQENKLVIESLKSSIFTASSSKEFDLYCGQTFLDNFLRGGYPVSLGDGKHVYYVYSRKHGDLEREYNFFQVDSSYFSQGNSNFRDVNQNRRNDVCFFPFTKDNSLKTFFNLIQLDGYNPLVLKGSKFSITSQETLTKTLRKFISKDDTVLFSEYLTKPFTPGNIINFIETNNIALSSCNHDALLDSILKISSKEDLADFHEGFWVDHWIYNNDLIERYLAIFPDKIEDTFFNDNSYTYYDNYEIVAPRCSRYVLTANGVRQLGSVVRIDKKEKIIKERIHKKNLVRTKNGEGDIYSCSLTSKIITLLLNKIASLDYNGVGVEMEANKPGWCDALNGLPAICGSSINESAAIKRLAELLIGIVDKVSIHTVISIPEEVNDFFIKISAYLAGKISDSVYWDLSNNEKEKYRYKVIYGITGIEKVIAINKLRSFLVNIVSKIDSGIEKALNKEDGIYYTYFINKVINFNLLKDENGNEIKDKNGYKYVQPIEFEQRAIPYFLEGPVHILKMQKDIDKARALHRAIKKSELYDDNLGKYKVNQNIMNETKEIGRQNVFPRGWLENEAVFLHMEYKYFLELLRCGLYDEFYECFKKALVPFLDPQVYGRSILENSSFIASTVHPDTKIHGTGFVSRLTGASAELLHMWSIMTTGSTPFIVNDKDKLCLKLNPVLPGWLFSEEPQEIEVVCDMQIESLDLPTNTFAFKFLGKTIIVYHNNDRKNTFGEKAALINYMELRNKGELVATVHGDTVSGIYPQQIRTGNIERIDVYFL